MSVQALEKMSYEKFRQKIAGFEDKSQILNDSDKENMRNEATRLCAILASLFGDDLDRTTLWDRIGNGLLTSVAKSGGNFHEFMNYVLIYIKADSAKTASSTALMNFIEMIDSKSNEWRKNFIQFILKNYFIIIVYGRKRWIDYKEGKVEL